MRLDLQYKEKKKRKRNGNSGGNNGTDTRNQRLFCFAVRIHVGLPVPDTVLYFCQKLFSSHLSHNYRYYKNKHDVFTNTESVSTFCTEISPVKPVLTSTESYVRQNDFRILKMPSDLKFVPVNYVLTPTDSRVRQIESGLLQMASDKYLTIRQYESSLPVLVQVQAFFMLRLNHILIRHAVFENPNSKISIPTHLTNISIIIGDNTKDTDINNDIVQVRYKYKA